MTPGEHCEPECPDEREQATGPPAVTFYVDADAFREIDAATRRLAVRRPDLAELFARPRPE